MIPLDTMLLRNGSIPFAVEKEKYKESYNLDPPFQLDYSWLRLLFTCSAVVLCFNHVYTGSKAVYVLSRHSCRRSYPPPPLEWRLV